MAIATLACMGAVASASAAPRPVERPVALGQPSSWPAPTAPAQVKGLGSATFGLPQAELARAVAADFGAATAAGLHRDDTADLLGRETWVTQRPWLTDAAPARLAFIFFAGKLVQINVDWAIPANATPAQRAALVTTAQGVAANLYASNWTVVSLRRGVRLGPDAVLVFSGEDALGRGAEIALFGMDLSGEGGKAPAADRGALLRVTYSADIFGRSVIRPGDF